MKKYVKNLVPDWIIPSEKQEMKQSPKIEFILSYDDLPVGFLTFIDDCWEFKYTKQFSIQNEIKVLTDFPDLNRVYKSETLWPFFAQRIPSINRPEIKKIIQSENIDSEDLVDLLIRFGRNTVTNPFNLNKSTAA